MLTLRPVPSKSRAIAHVPGAKSEPVTVKPRTEPIKPLTELAMKVMAASGAISKARMT